MADKTIGSIEFDENLLYSKPSSTIWNVTYENTCDTTENIKELFENENDVMDSKTINYLKWIEDREERRKAIIDYLKKNCVDVAKEVRFDRIKWAQYFITLPSLNWSTNWKLVNFSVSNKTYSEDEYNNDRTCNVITEDVKNIPIIFDCMRDFFRSFDVNLDDDIDFANDLFSISNCETWNSLKELIPSLKNKYYVKLRGAPITWNCNKGHCWFDILDKSPKKIIWDVIAVDLKPKNKK